MRLPRLDKSGLAMTKSEGFAMKKKRGRGQAPPRQIHVEEKNIVDPF
jgi:hypothetical protein